ncbi:MAG TPA: hypothetical protein VFD70_00895 [Anaerolineae bacterium]|nr:hypothetical protein [Anaerolineae bacterium]
MKLLVSVSIIFVLLIVFLSQVLTTDWKSIAKAGPLSPTPAPPPTVGPPPPIKEFHSPYLDRAVDKQEAINIALNYDKQFAIWNSPWSAKDLNSQAGWIQIQSFPDRGFDGHKYGPGAEVGPVWVITIKGQVQMTGLGSDGRTHGSVRYIIAQRTGHLLGWRTGP